MFKGDENIISDVTKRGNMARLNGNFRGKPHPQSFETGNSATPIAERRDMMLQVLTVSIYV